ncbi:MarR family transcriptional regulator [bacterium]|nr:MarR family transcriptional regulator [FCB group bacterium]MBL7190442.1 MarR family transcriptional regulator [bacterium]
MNNTEERAARLTEYFFTLFRSFQSKECGISECPEVEISIQEMKVLAFLGQSGPCIMRETADALSIAVSTLTGIVDKLVQKGLVNRDRSDDDRRIVKVELSEKGREIEQWHFKQRAKMSLRMLQALNDEDQETLLELISKIVNTLK